jgi:hypothetical protein
MLYLFLGTMAVMTIETLEAMLRSLGWMPIAGDVHPTTRAWKRVDDARPMPIIIRVPRTTWIGPIQAARILRAARRVDRR